MEERELHVAQCKQLISYCAVLPYKEYIIAWDIANRDRFSIEAGLLKGKITKEQVRKVWHIALNYIDNLADKIYIKDLIAEN